MRSKSTASAPLNTTRVERGLRLTSARMPTLYMANQKTRDGRSMRCRGRSASPRTERPPIMTTARREAKRRSSRSKRRTTVPQVRRAGLAIGRSVSQPPPEAGALLTRPLPAVRVGRMSFLGKAILAFWADVDASGEADYNDWHTREHMPERCGVPGFLRGRRYVAVAAAPKYFMMYETETLETLASPAYVERLNNPTPWTRKCLALFRNSNRTACRNTLSLGHGIGGAMATTRLGQRATSPGISAAHLCEADVETTTVKTAEKAIRDKPDEVARWVLLVEGSDADIVGRTCREGLDAKTLEARGAEPGSITGIYALHY